MNLVEVKINGLILEHKTQQNIVVLREAEGDRLLPIWIGPIEAQAIRRLLSGEQFARPLTHDLIQLLLEGLKAKVARVIIARLEDNTFYADVVVRREGELVVVDARPSDSIAIALRAGAPVFVNEDLLQPPPQMEAEEQREEQEGEARELTEEEKAEKLRRFLERLKPEDFGKPGS